MSTKSSRNPSLDVLRITAFFLVVSLHFLHCSEFSTLVTEGRSMLIMTVVRAVAVCCVPLFIMLTGYLQTNKTLSGKYYLGIIRPAVTYVLAGAACLIFKIVEYGYSTDPVKLLLQILDFSASDYGWYMEMYFGLFLMIPFLNAAYHGMKSRKQKLILVGTCLVLTALPGLLNTFNFLAEGWWEMPSLDRTYNKLIPAWWSGFYPVTYYFIGSYLREYPLKLKRLVNLLLLALCAAAAGCYYYYRLKGSAFFYGAFLTNASLSVAAVSVLIFSLIAERDMRRLPSPLQKVLATVSGWTLAAYLVSQIFDVLFYRELKAAIPEIMARMKYAPIMVLSVFAASLILGGIIDTLFRIGNGAVMLIIKKIKNHKPERQGDTN